jgi:amidase
VAVLHFDTLIRFSDPFGGDRKYDRIQKRFVPSSSSMKAGSNESVTTEKARMSIMATYQFQPTQYFTAIGWYPPVLRIAPGDTVITTTVDAGGGDQHGKPITPGGNPQTGPFLVEGAEPGDMLAVHLDRLSPSRSTGFTRTLLSPQVLDPPSASAHLHETGADWDLDLTRGIATLRPSAAITRPLVVPLAPMLGCFGVAPTWGSVLSWGWPCGPRGRGASWDGDRNLL